MMAILELIKIFKKLFEAYGNYAKYDLLFLLTPSGSLNYKGTDAFLESLPEAYSQSIAFALSLDSIGVNPNLYLHISRSPKTTEQLSINLFEVRLNDSKLIGSQYNREADENWVLSGSKTD